MNRKILLISPQEITSPIKDGLNNRGYQVLHVRNIETTSRINLTDFSTIIDATNLITGAENLPTFTHNTKGIIELLQLAKDNSIPLVFLYNWEAAANAKSSTNLAINLINKYKSYTDVICSITSIADIYGPNIVTSKTLRQFLESITHGVPLRIKNDLKQINLIHEDDLADGISNVAEELAESNTSKNYALIPEEPITELELAHFLNELTDLNLEITYKTKSHPAPSNQFQTPAKSYPNGWAPRRTLEDGLKELFNIFDIPIPLDAHTELSEEKIKLTQEIVAEKEKTPLTTSKRGLAQVSTPSQTKASSILIPTKVKVTALTITLILISLLPSFLFLNNVRQGLAALEQSSKSIKSMDLDTARTQSEKATKHLNRLNEVPKPVSLGLSLLGLSQANTTALITTSQNLAQAIYNLSLVNLSNYANLDKPLASGAPRVLGASTSKEANLATTIQLIDVLQNNVASLEIKNLGIKEKIETAFTAIESNKDTLIKLNNIKEALPELFGLTNDQKYLVVFQDSSELRATGGIIDSYATLEFKNGNASISQIKPSQFIDGQLELSDVSVTPPLPIRKAFGKNRLSIKDANWNPDFSLSARQILDLYEKAMKDKLDGVIAVDQNFAKTFKALYNEPTRAQLAQIIFNALEEKQILVFHTNDKVLSAIWKNDWGGSIRPYKDDYLYIIDTNLSGNKSNAYITKSIQYKGFKPTDENGYIRELTLTYKNSGKPDKPIDSNYLNHLRIILPQDAFLNSATLITNGEEANITRKVEVVPYGSRAMYTTDILVEAQETVSLIIEYESPRNNFSNGVNLFVQKQPGTKADPLNIRFIYSENNEWQTSTSLKHDQNLKIPL